MCHTPDLHSLGVPGPCDAWASPASGGCKLHLAMALIGIMKWHSVYGTLGFLVRGMHEYSKGGNKKTPLSCLHQLTLNLRLFYGRFVARKTRRKRTSRDNGYTPGSFTLQEIGMMPETGANQCHFVMPFTMAYTLINLRACCGTS